MDAELVAMIDKANAIHAGMRRKREENRARFPTVSVWVDDLNAAGLGPVRVICAEENGNRVAREDA